MLNSVIIVCTALLLGLIIFFAELARGRVAGLIDFLRATSVVYFISFVFVPVYLQLANLDIFRGTFWDWMFKTNFNDSAFVYASLLSLIGYLCILAGYTVARAFVKNAQKAVLPELLSLTGTGYLLTAGTLLLGISLVSLVVYVQSIGGVGNFFALAMVLRLDNPLFVSKLAFLKNVIPLALGSSFIFFALCSTPASGRVTRRLAAVLFVAAFLTSLATLFHQAGRLNLFTYLLTFPAARMVYRNRINKRYVVLGGLVFVFLVLFGKELFNYLVHPEAFFLQLRHVLNDASYTLNSLFVEYIFPTLDVANVIQEVPAHAPFRWFSDLPLALLYLLPQRVIGFEPPPDVSQINTFLFNPSSGGIPVDIVSFGYFSAGVVGILLTTFFFGVLLVLFERLLPMDERFLIVMFRVAWMLFVSYRVMYAQPNLVVRDGFQLIVSSCLLFVPAVASLLFSRMRRAQVQAAPAKR